MTGDEFRTWRRKRYRTQKELGDLFGVNIMTICRWERGDTTPPGRLLELACKGLDLERMENERDAERAALSGKWTPC